MSFSFQALPFAVVSVGLVWLAILAAVSRGDTVVRLAFVLIAITALPWSMSLAIGLLTTDDALALRLYRLGFAPIPVVGAGLLMVILAVAGKLDSQRGTVVAAIAIGVSQAVLALASDLIILKVQHLGPDGTLAYPVAGRMYLLHVGAFAAWVCTGLILSRRTLGWRRGGRRPSRVVMAIAVLALLTINDGLIAYQVVRTYPLATIPAGGAVGLSIYAIARGNILRGQGVDRAIRRELVTILIAGAVLAVLTVVVAPPLRATALVLVSSLVAGGVVVVSRTGARDVDTPAEAAQLALDRFFDRVAAATTIDEATRVATELVESRLLATHVRIWCRIDERWSLVRGIQVAPPLPISDAIEAWLRRRGSFVVDDLATERLDRRRGAIEAWARSLDADVVVPLVDRDALVGLLVGTRVLPLRDAERVVLDEAARATARALTVLGLTREAERRAELVREVELADAVRQSRAAGDVRDLGRNRVAVTYQPTAQVAGDLWNCVALPDDRLLVLVGDVVGRGLSAALVSAAVHGASQTAAGLLAARATPAAVLGLLHDTVASIDGGRHRVTALVVIVDPVAGRVEWGSAGYRAGYVVRRRAEAVELLPLGARGTALGEPERVIGSGARELDPGDVIVLTSDGVVEARDRGGIAFGERRLQRALRTPRPVGGDALAHGVVEAVRAHVGDAPLEDDLLLVAIDEPR